MSAQQSLFDRFSKLIPDEQKKAPKIAITSPPRQFEFKMVHYPMGKPDKRGKYAYERFHTVATKLDENARVMFFELLQMNNADLIANMVAIGVAWEKLNPVEQIDYCDAIGIGG